MTDVTGHPIKEIVKVGAADGGQIVHFTVKFEDDSTVTLLCKQERIGLVITSIAKAAKMAADERAKINPHDGKVGDVQLIDPFEYVTGTIGFIQSPGTQPQVGLRIHTTRNITVDIAIPQRQTAELIRDLQKTLDQIPNLKPQKLH